MATLDMTATSTAPLDAVGTLGQIRERALARLDPAVGDFLEGGAGEESTLARNRAAFAQWALRPRLMSGLGMPDLSTTFLGVPLSMPVLTAPFGADGLFDHEGQIAVARANEAAGTASIVPEAGTHPIEDVARAAPTAAAIGQLHPLGTDESFLRMVRRYEDAGFRALCITCDCPTAGWRERNLANGFSPSEAVIGGNYPPGSDPGLTEVFGQLFEMDQAVWSWDRLGGLLRETRLPWIAKGVLTGEDALAAVAAGARGLLVSNHGGRQLDGVTAALDALPEVRAAVGPDIAIALDSGVRRGADIVTALALGADVVVLGRLAVYGLAAGGEAGVARVFELLRQELTTVLTLLGRGGVRDLGPEAVQRVRAAG